MEWFYYDKHDKATKGCLVIFIIPVTILVGVLIFMRSPKGLDNAPEVKLEQEEVCMGIRSNVLYDKLTSAGATEYFELSRPTLVFGGSFDIKCKESELAKQKFNSVFLSDSAAYHMEEDYHHIFQFDEQNLKVRMRSHSGGKYTTVPAWLIVRLIDEGLLTLSEN